MTSHSMSAALDAIRDEATRLAKILRSAGPGDGPPEEAAERLRLIVALARCKYDVRASLDPAARRPGLPGPAETMVVVAGVE